MEKQLTIEEIADKFFEEQEKLNVSYDSREAFIEGYKLAKEMVDEQVREASEEAFWDREEMEEELEDAKQNLENAEREIETLQEKNMPFRIETLDDEMKVEVLQGAMKKYTLTELENRLGNKFDLM